MIEQRRRILRAAGLAAVPFVPVGALALASAAVQAQPGWPAKPITLISPIAAGGGNDLIARMLARQLGARMNHTVVVENKPGAGGTLGSDFVSKSAPDGHTLLLTSVAIATSAASGRRLPFDVSRDFEPVGLLGITPLLIVVGADSRFKTLRHLLDEARARPGTVSFGSTGVGSPNHLAGELLASEGKVRMLHVPYKGIGPAMTDVLGGNLDLVVATPSSTQSHIKAGKARALAMTSLQRSPLMPDIPTAAESGLPGFQLESWWAVLGPARLPAPVVKRLNDDINVLLAHPEVRDFFAREGAVTRPGPPDEVRRLIQFEVARWTRLIKEAGIQPE
jgi:tripartite-type tricarboxylate transporter receptor subunit TctC